jgi:hypothetical protein
VSKIVKPDRDGELDLLKGDLDASQDPARRTPKED